jgi:hypothetical protein
MKVHYKLLWLDTIHLKTIIYLGFSYPQSRYQLWTTDRMVGVRLGNTASPQVQNITALSKT